jgi:hypothetical protein
LRFIISPNKPETAGSVRFCKLLHKALFQHALELASLDFGAYSRPSDGLVDINSRYSVKTSSASCSRSHAANDRSCSGLLLNFLLSLSISTLETTTASIFLGRTVDFLLSKRRDVAAAKCFFHKAMKHQGTPRVITLNAYAASHRAITELKSEGTMPHRVRIRSSSYLNNVVEQDHRCIEHQIRPMLGFKRLETAAITIRGIELAEKIRKHQFKTGKLPGRPKAAPEIWAAVLAA